MSKDLRIVFMGTPEFSVAILKRLVAENKNIVGVITAPDRPAGRGRKLQMSAVKEFALDKDIKVLQPTNLKSKKFLESLKAMNANLQIVVAFRMLPKAVWSMPENGTFNLHASLLPQYRGAAPINWAIINSEEVTGVTTFFIDNKIDTGEIILQSETPMEPLETAESLHDKLMLSGAQLVLETVELIEKGDVKTSVQPVINLTALKSANKLDSHNTRINWNKNPKEIDAFVRGLSPYPCAWTTFNDESGSELKMKVYSVSTALSEDHEIKNEGDYGNASISKKELKIDVKNGVIFIDELQLPGKRKMKITELLNGYNFPENCRLV